MTKKGVKFDKTAAFQFNDKYYILTGQNHKESSVWYKVAFDNYKTAKTLLENNRIAPCIFYLQQSAECMTKACLLSVDLTNFKSLKDISHSPDAAFDYIFETLGDAENNNLANSTTSDDFSCRLENVLSEWNALLSNLLEEDGNAEEKAKNFEIANGVEQIYNIPTEDNISFLPSFIRDVLIKTYKVNLYKSYIWQLYTQKSIYLFSKLMRGTESNSRYPDKDLRTPSDIYNISIREKLSNLLDHLFNLFGFISVGNQIEFEGLRDDT